MAERTVIRTALDRTVVQVIRPDRLTRVRTRLRGDTTGGGAVDSVDDLTGAVNLDSTRQRVATAPVMVADGATIPAGTFAALLLGTTAVLPDAVTHGLGQTMYLTPFGGACVLSGSGSDVVQAGSGLTLQPGLTYGVSAGDISAFVPGAASWGLATTNLVSAQVQALIDIHDADATAHGGINGAAIASAISAAVASEATVRGDSDHDALTAASYSLDPPEAWFEFPDDTNSDLGWSTPDLDELVGMPDMRALVHFERGTYEFNEIWTRTFDGGFGAEDSPEMAVFTPAPDQSPRLFLESVATGETEDEEDISVPVDIEGVWVLLRTYYPTTTSAVGQIAVRWGGDETTNDGRQWRTLSTYERPLGGIAYDTDEPWWLGLRFSGRIAWGELYDGPDGTLVASPDAADWTTSTSFTDGQGNAWVTAAGTVRKSNTERVKALEDAGGGASTWTMLSDTTVGPLGVAQIDVELPTCRAIKISWGDARSTRTGGVNDTLMCRFEVDDVLDSGPNYSNLGAVNQTAAFLALITSSAVNADRSASGFDLIGVGVGQSTTWSGTNVVVADNTEVSTTYSPHYGAYTGTRGGVLTGLRIYPSNGPLFAEGTWITVEVMV